MRNYRSEAAFSKDVVKVLRTAGWFVQRIESGDTGRGIPDIYCITPAGASAWVELKRLHRNVSPLIMVPWRPGQQRWLYEVYRRRQRAFTLVAMDDEFLLITNDRIYVDNCVPIEACRRLSSLQELL